MKTIRFIILSAFTLYLSPCIAQEVVFDPQHCEAVIENGAVRSSAESTHNNYLGKIDGNLNTINTNVSSVVLAQTIIYNGLANVNSALKDGLEVKYMATITTDMIGYLGQALALAKGKPYLLLFASSIANEMKARSLTLVSDVSAFVLKEGSNMLADYNSRDQLLHNITIQLQILDSLAYGAWRAMYWASQQSLFSTLNPWQAYVNQDQRFVREIIAGSKYLRAHP